MKKILLGTTTLIGAAGLLAGAAFAETPKVTLGGDANFEMGWVSEDLDSGLRSDAFRSATTLKVRVDGKGDNGLGYGGGVDLSADTSAQSTQAANASRTFIYLDGNWGRAEMGSDVGAQQTMKVDVTNIAHATGGSDWRWFVNSNVGTATNIYWGMPELDLQYGTVALGAFGNEYDENINKVTYYTPRWNGFQVGVSYLPDNTSTGQVVNRRSSAATPIPAGLFGGAAPTFQNIWAGGVGYQGKFSGVGVDVSATGEHGKSTNTSVATGLEDLRTWEAGGKLSYMNFSLAGSYGNLGDSGRARGVARDDTRYWTAGGAYDMGPFGASVTYFDSERELGATPGTDRLTNLSVGTDYKLAPGLTPFAEVSWIDQNSPTATLDIKSTVVLVGTQLSF